MKHENRAQAAIIAIVVVVLVVAAVAAYYFLAKPPAEKFACDICDAEFDTPEELEDHMFDEHGVIPEELPREQTWYTNWGPQAIMTLNPLTGDDYGFGEIYQSLALGDFIGGGWEPIIAESWEWIDDYTWEVNLRPEAHFWDGTPITAEVVKWDMEILANENYSGVLTDTFEEMIESVEIVDDHTLRFTVNEDYSHYVVGIEDLLWTSIFPKERWSELIDEYGEGILEYQNLDFDDMNASGPYRPVSYTAGDEATFARVKDWWGEEIGWYAGPNYVKHRYIEEAHLVWEMFKAGDFDWIDGSYVTGLVEKLKSDPDRFRTWGQDATGSPIFPTMSGAWVLIPSYETLPIVCNNQWLRYALAYAIPYEDLRTKTETYQNCLGGSPSFINTSVAAQEYIDEELIRNTFETVEESGSPVIKYDRDKAIEILEEHCEGSVDDGWTYNGEKIGDWKIEAPNGWTLHMSWARIIAQAWSDIGIPAEEDFPDFMVLCDEIASRDFDWHVMGAFAWTVSNTVMWNINHAILGPPEPWWGSPVWYEKWWPEEAEQISGMLDELATYEWGDPEGIALCKEMQAIYVPQLVAIPIVNETGAPIFLKDYWVNWNIADDWYPFMDEVEFYDTRVRTSFVETTGVELSSETVEPGEPVTVKVTLKNTGERAHRYPVYVRNGPAEPGPGPEALAHTAVVVPAGETITAELTVTIDEPGIYTLTVDDWRIDEWDLGDPIEKTLTVT